MSLLDFVMTPDELADSVERTEAAKSYRFFTEFTESFAQLHQAFRKAGVNSHPITTEFKMSAKLIFASDIESGWFISRRENDLLFAGVSGRYFIVTTKRGKVTSWSTVSNSDAAQFYLPKDADIDGTRGVFKIDRRDGKTYVGFATVSVEETLANFVHNYTPKSYLSNTVPIK